MELTKLCANCQKEFTPAVDWQKCCNGRCTNALNARRHRAKHRKGGGGGGGNGGGGAPTLFDTITPVDSRSIYAPDTNYRTLDMGLESSGRPLNG